MKEDINTTLIELLNNRGKVLNILSKSINNSDKIIDGLKKLSNSDNEKLKTEKLLEICRNQTIQIKYLSILAFLYTQGDSYEKDITEMLFNSGASPEEAIRSMFNNKKV